MNTPLHAYLRDYADFRRRLFALYTDVGANIAEHRNNSGGGWTFGYRLVSDGDLHGQSLAGTSIGDDEIRLFFDMSAIVPLRSTFVIGNAFGLSTFCFALADTANQVYAIDNWSGGEGGARAKLLCEKIVGHHKLRNVHIHTGSSPQDVPEALAALTGPLSAVFIDGWHTDEQVRLDFLAVQDRLTPASLVLIHDCRLVNRGFEDVYRHFAQQTYDRHHILRTYGQLGVIYSSREHPELDQYLTETNLIWREFTDFIPLVVHADRFRRILTNERMFSYRVLRRACRYAAPWIHW